MDQYYYIDERDGRQRGPISASGLRSRGIGPDTLLWRRGMQAWAPAGSLGELSHWFRDGYDNADAYGRRSGERYRRRGGFAGPKPSGLIGWAVLAMLLCAVTGVAALVYAIIANSFWEIREFDGAERAAERSKLWCVVSAAIFLCVFIVTGALALVLWSGRI